MKAAIYPRVSTDNQEAEGTSLQTQSEACREYCHEKGYEVAFDFSETYSGLTLDRPRLNELRELVRSEQIDVVVVYCLDRLSRNATHGVILRDELDNHNVGFESVTEDLDKTPLGEAITYLRGTFAQIEAEKIKERTSRGRRARVKEGRMAGSFHTIYGYDYVPVSQDNGGRRNINEIEARWVKQIYLWLVNDGMAAAAIRDKLKEAGAPTKKGGKWTKSTVLSILKNPAYAGKTYAYTTDKGRVHQKPREEWIEIPDVTPRIISDELFEAAQTQLRVNSEKATRNNTKHQYLLGKHLRCKKCGRTYVGNTDIKKRKKDIFHRRLYRCLGKKRDHSPIELCKNKGWGADKLETLVWAKLETYLSDRDLIMGELQRQGQEAEQVDIFETELKHLEHELKAVDREQRQLLQWALKGFPEDQVEAQNKRLNKARESIHVQKAELEKQVHASHEAVISVPKLENFIAHIQHRLSNLDFEEKRLALEMLGITVWLDGEAVEITGTIDPEMAGIATTPSL